MEDFDVPRRSSAPRYYNGQRLSATPEPDKYINIQTPDTAAGPASFSGTVASVPDGDVIVVASGGRNVAVRLAGIDSPEKNQEFGPQARQFVMKKALRKTVTVYPQGVDGQKRIVGKVNLAEGGWLEEEATKAGMAWRVPQNSADEKVLVSLETAAKQAGRGLWADCCAVAPWEFRRGVRSPAKGTTAAKQTPSTQKPPAARLASVRPASAVEANGANAVAGPQTQQPNAGRTAPLQVAASPTEATQVAPPASFDWRILIPVGFVALVAFGLFRPRKNG